MKLGHREANLLSLEPAEGRPLAHFEGRLLEDLLERPDATCSSTSGVASGVELAFMWLRFDRPVDVPPWMRTASLREGEQLRRARYVGRRYAQWVANPEVLNRSASCRGGPWGDGRKTVRPRVRPHRRGRATPPQRFAESTSCGSTRAADQSAGRGYEGAKQLPSYGGEGSPGRRRRAGCLVVDGIRERSRAERRPSGPLSWRQPGPIWTSGHRAPSFSTRTWDPGSLRVKASDHVKRGRCSGRRQHGVSSRPAPPRLPRGSRHLHPRRRATACIASSAHLPVQHRSGCECERVRWRRETPLLQGESYIRSISAWKRSLPEYSPPPSGLRRRTSAMYIRFRVPGIVDPNEDKVSDAAAIINTRPGIRWQANPRDQERGVGR